MRARQDVVGQFVRAGADSVRIRPMGASDLGVARSSIARARVSLDASRWRTAFLLGIGWSLGMAAAVAIDELDHDHDHRGRAALIGAGVGFGAGVLVGASRPVEWWRGVRP